MSARKKPQNPAEFEEKPTPNSTAAEDKAAAGNWGSDAVAACLRALDLPYVCLNPGASYRGLHDSLVNYLGNTQPKMLLCLHEEHAIAIAHGYAKVTGRPLGAIVHSNVGLMHASMAIFNAWCDRQPVIVLGATGPVDAAQRRPWIDWIHTARDQGALVRNFTKWDDQPASIPATQESLLRAALLAQTAPRGPVYVCLDAALQEERLDSVPPLPDVNRFRPAPPPEPAPQRVDQAARWLHTAKAPIILMGRATRDETAWHERVALAEALSAAVVTDLKLGAVFPTDHPLHVGAPGLRLSEASAARLRAADVILSLDWVDLAGSLKQAGMAHDTGAKIIHVSVDQYSHNGWSMDYQGLPPIDLHLLTEPAVTVTRLLEAVHTLGARKTPALAPPPRTPAPAAGGEPDEISLPQLAAALQQAVAGEKPCLLRLPLGWGGDFWHFRHPLDYLGSDGGGGIGSGPGMVVGAALALQGHKRLPLAVLGDGDFLMGVTALWTAAHYRIPVLIVVANNRSYFNDELHQERVAQERGRPVANRWIGQRISDPDIDLAALARGQGLHGIGPVSDPRALATALAEGVAAVKNGASCVIDVRVTPGYYGAMASGLTPAGTRG